MTGTPDPSAGPGGGAVTPWFQGAADTDTVAYMTSRGWHDKPVATVALEAVKAHKEASSALTRFGATDPARIAVLPDPAKPEEGAAFWERLGRPKDVAGYDLSGVKFSDGVDPTEFKSAFATKALELNLPKGTAEALAAFHVSEVERAAGVETTAERLAAAQSASRLEADWGPNLAEFKMLASKGAASLGWDEATFNALQGSVGYDKTMNLMRFLGQMGSEGRFVGTDLAGGKSLVMTATEAQAQKTGLLANPEWLKDFGTNADKQKQLRSLDEVIVNAQAGQYRGVQDSHG